MALRAGTPIPFPSCKSRPIKSTAKVSPMLYGLMTEEINFSYEGGIYGELIRNRTFKADATSAVYWSTVGSGSISLDTTAPLNDALNVSLKLDATQASKDSPAGFANGGYWGIPVRPNTAYHVSFYAKSPGGFSGAVTASIQSADGKTIFASAEISGITGDWKKFDATLTTKDAPRRRTTSSPSRRLRPARSGSSKSRCFRRRSTIARTATVPTSCNCSRT